MTVFLYLLINCCLSTMLMFFICASNYYYYSGIMYILYCFVVCRSLLAHSQTSERILHVAVYCQLSTLSGVPSFQYISSSYTTLILPSPSLLCMCSQLIIHTTVTYVPPIFPYSCFFFTFIPHNNNSTYIYIYICIYIYIYIYIYRLHRLLFIFT